MLQVISGNLSQIFYINVNAYVHVNVDVQDQPAISIMRSMALPVLNLFR